MTPLVTHWRVASAATVLVLAGSSAVALAVYNEPDQGALASRAWPAGARSHQLWSGRRGGAAVAGLPSVTGAPWQTQLSPPAVMALRQRGWPLPMALPGGMTLVGASEMSGATGRVIGLSYTDGLSMISLFVQRGELAAPPPGWHDVAISGQIAYTAGRDEQVIAWSGDSYVFTVISAAPLVSVDQAIAALPHGGPPGFWVRLGRGFRRLASWVDPFR